MKKTFLVLILMFGVTIFAGTSFEFRAGTSMFDFLRLPVGAVNLALNQTNIASIDNGLAGLINPSRLDEIGNWDIRGGSTNWVFDTAYQYIAVAKRVSEKKGVVSLVVRNYDYGDFDYTKPWGYIKDPTESGETFTGGSIASTLSWGKQLTKTFCFGLALNYAVETLEDYSMDAVYLNVGFSYENQEYLKGLRLGFTAENFGTTIKYFEDSDALTLPLAMRYGLLWDIYQHEKHHLILEFNATQFKDQDIFMSGAATYSFNSMIYLFAGYTTNIIYFPVSGGVSYKFRLGKAFCDANIAYNITKNFGGKVTFEMGVMTF